MLRSAHKGGALCHQKVMILRHGTCELQGGQLPFLLISEPLQPNFCLKTEQNSKQEEARLSRSYGAGSPLEGMAIPRPAVRLVHMLFANNTATK